jgi:spore coat protein A, manganese oxidase
VTKIHRAIVAVAAAGGMLVATSASAQVWTQPVGTTPTGTNNAFPAQNPSGPIGAAYQVNYPYPGQCLADMLNANLFPTLKQCAGGSFAGGAGVSERTDGGWAGTAVPASFKVLGPVLPISVPPAGIPATPKFTFPVLNPMDYTPEPAFGNTADYYVLGVHEAWGAQNIGTAGTLAQAKALPGINNVAFGLFPDPTVWVNPITGTNLSCKDPANTATAVTCDVPNGMQWTGLVCQTAGGCSCPADASPNFVAKYCSSGGKVPVGNPLFTPIWGVGQINVNGGPVTSTLATVLGGAAKIAGTYPPSETITAPNRWSNNGYAATWPSISVRGTKGRPVVVKWVNEFPNNHVLCPHPEAADWPCAIDRTFMGVKARIDPSLVPTDALGKFTIPPNGVNQYGSPQQPDNSWVTHLHGGEIPPSTDGFAEKWFGNAVTAAKYANVAQNNVQPPFEAPVASILNANTGAYESIELKRPPGSADTYAYPMVQEEATIWFHDHTLGKTHHNVIAGPAGFFPVKEPLKHGSVAAGVCATGQDCSYTWLDPVTEPRDDLNVPRFDLFLAVQDRAFNDDGSINFSNGLGQAIPVPPAPVPPLGYTPVTAGANPMVHPVWVPEYFGDHSVVNGVLWPKIPVEAGWHRVRLVDGSDSRCYTVGLSVVAGLNAPTPAAGAAVKNNLAFWVIANDQGYLKNPVKASTLTMCPGERYELLINFGAVGNGVANGGAATVFVTNSAAAPFPAGLTPQALNSPFADLNVLMRFDVDPAKGQGVKSCGVAAVAGLPRPPTALTWNQALTPAANLATACMPANPALVVDPNYAPQSLRPAGWPLPVGTAAIVRQVYMNEKVDGVTLAPLGMQLNGVPFEYKVTETPKIGTTEYWQFVNLTVDAHPMHPHLVKHQIVARQTFNVGQYKARLCGSTTCQPGPAPGNEMQVVPDVTLNLTGNPVLVLDTSVEGGFKDASQVPPAKVTTIVAKWTGRWKGSGDLAVKDAAGVVIGTPGTADAPGTTAAANVGTNAAAWTYETAYSGPYVWHCHINSHEDSEMMRTSLVVP